MNANTIGIGSLQLEMWQHNKRRQRRRRRRQPAASVATSISNARVLHEFQCINDLWNILALMKIVNAERVADDAMRYHHRPVNIMIKLLMMMMAMMLLAMVGLAKRTQNREWLPTTTSISFFRFMMIFDKYQPGARKTVNIVVPGLAWECDCVSCVYTVHRRHSCSVSACSYNHSKHLKQKNEILANSAFRFCEHMRSDHRCSFIIIRGPQSVGTRTLAMLCTVCWTQYFNSGCVSHRANSRYVTHPRPINSNRFRCFRTKINKNVCPTGYVIRCCRDNGPALPAISVDSRESEEIWFFSFNFFMRRGLFCFSFVGILSTTITHSILGKVNKNS